MATDYILVNSSGLVLLNGSDKLILQLAGDAPSSSTPESYFTFSEGTITKYIGVTWNGSAFVPSEGALNVVIPSTINSTPVTTIDVDAFVDVPEYRASFGIQTLVIPDSVTTIADEAFYYNALTSVTFGNSLTTIGGYAFQFNSLTSITIPASVTSIGDSAFSNNNITQVTFNGSAAVISENNPFDNNSGGLSYAYSVGGAGTYVFSGGVWTKQ